MLTPEDNERIDKAVEQSAKMMTRLRSPFPRSKPSALRENEEKLDLEEKKMEVQDAGRRDEYNKFRDGHIGRKAAIRATKEKYAKENKDEGSADPD